MDDEVLRAVEAAMVRIRRSTGRRTLGREMLAAAPPGTPDLATFAVLDAVEEGPEDGADVVTVGDVAVRTDADPSRASRRVAAAVEAGHLRRTPSQRDARRVGLELTASGRALVDHAHAHRQARFAAAMAGWTPAERAQFADLLTRFTT